MNPDKWVDSFCSRRSGDPAVTLLCPNDAKALFSRPFRHNGCMTQAKRPRAPESLDTTGAALWRDVLKAYELSPAELAVLARCCRTMDVLARIDAELIDSDLVVEGSVGQLRAIRSWPSRATKNGYLTR